MGIKKKTIRISANKELTDAVLPLFKSHRLLLRKELGLRLYWVSLVKSVAWVGPVRNPEGCLSLAKERKVEA